MAADGTTHPSSPDTGRLLGRRKREASSRSGRAVQQDRRPAAESLECPCRARISLAFMSCDVLKLCDSSTAGNPARRLEHNRDLSVVMSRFTVMSRLYRE